MNAIHLRSFTALEQSTWKILFEGQEGKRSQQIVDVFSDGIRALGISSGKIPDLSSINNILEEKTGYMGVPVEGLEGPISFFSMLAERKFPIGNFIRSPEDLSYTPAPDIFHDLYGHLPFYTDLDYANFCQKMGEAAAQFFGDPKRLRQFERLFWFTFEFGLLQTSQGLRIFGAGIASSIAECRYALSNAPEIVPFDLDLIRNQEYRIDQMQPRLYLLEDVKQLYGCLDEFIERVKGPCRNWVLETENRELRKAEEKQDEHDNSEHPKYIGLNRV